MITLDDAIQTFLDDLAVGRSGATVRAYRIGLDHFRLFLQPPPETKPKNGEEAPPPPPRITLDQLTVDQAVEFARSLSRQEANLSKSSQFLYTTAVSRFYSYIIRERLRTDLPVQELQLRLNALRGRVPKRLPRVPADDAIEKMVKTARTRPPSSNKHGELIRLRNIALVETLRGSGMRVSEVVSLRRGDLDRQTMSARITGKGAKDRVVYFTPEAWRAIDAYLQARQDGKSGRNLASLPVFARHDPTSGSRAQTLSTTSVREIIYQLAKDAELEELTITPHRFRAWFATHLVEVTGDLAAVQDLLGHESANTTRVYTKVRGGRLRDIHRRAFGIQPQEDTMPVTPISEAIE